MRYKVLIKDTTFHSGYIEMSEEEYEKLCSEDGDIQINEIRAKAIFTNKWDEKILEEFYFND